MSRITVLILFLSLLPGFSLASGKDVGSIADKQKRNLQQQKDAESAEKNINKARDLVCINVHKTSLTVIEELKRTGVQFKNNSKRIFKDENLLWLSNGMIDKPYPIYKTSFNNEVIATTYIPLFAKDGKPAPFPKKIEFEPIGARAGILISCDFTLEQKAAEFYGASPVEVSLRPKGFFVSDILKEPKKVYFSLFENDKNDYGLIQSEILDLVEKIF